MGKIFDALEKAGKSNDPGRTKFATERTPKPQTTINGNVVPLTAHKQPLPSGPEGIDPNLVTLHSPQSVEAELFKVLRTNLLFPSTGRPPKSIMVTSALPGEGKSFVCANLAVSIAKGIEEHVLLIDADIRKPTIHIIFGLEQASGLSQYLVTGSDVSRHFAKSTIPKLTILPAGKPPENPMELLTTQKMKALLEEVAQRYEDRYIVIDSAPPSLATETAAIANYVDGIIIVVKAGRTPRNAVSELIEQLGKEKILGIVMNHSDHTVKKYYGYGKSYYKSTPEQTT